MLGGTGVRYYGEYCVVLKEDPHVVPDDTLVLDRNSYDVMFEPLKGCGPVDGIVKRLRGQWDDGLVAMVKMRILPALGAAPRLATSGTASDVLLHDENFVEVHKQGTFGPGAVTRSANRPRTLPSTPTSRAATSAATRCRSKKASGFTAGTKSRGRWRRVTFAPGSS